ncbi:MAG: ribbon-helix-helix domain-containing protein [Candidatus Saccharimonadales bacterium]
MKSTQSQTVNITLPKGLLKRVDALAKRDYTSRSDIIRQALLEKIRKAKLDEWGDPVSENWQTVADFSNLPSGGMPAETFMTLLQKVIDEQERKSTPQTSLKD